MNEARAKAKVLRGWSETWTQAALAIVQCTDYRREDAATLSTHAMRDREPFLFWYGAASSYTTFHETVGKLGQGFTDLLLRFLALVQGLNSRSHDDDVAPQRDHASEMLPNLHALVLYVQNLRSVALLFLLQTVGDVPRDVSPH